ncbi:CbiQ family ECF transporter T component [Actinotalea caeni]|uniref:CbiQ family ECF transporter T component n=1 Tax=Actinotalea caeni TaxID=1348467 RepID=UPI0012E2A507|nr:CbiQ family ECF transporter T component [Actinotalea caeni]
MTTTAERVAPAAVLRPGRALHPLAWWAWALALAAALSRVTNPVGVLLLAAAVVVVVLACRGDDRWGRAFRGYLVLAGVVVAVRVVFHALVGLDGGGPVLLDLPGVALPTWAGGIDLLGPVRLTGLLHALYGGLALGTLLLCFGAANSLSDPVRALRALPAALHPLGTAVVVAVTVAPRLVTSFARVRRAQRLRGVAPTGRRGVQATVVPVLGDALDHALALAASMDSRGYARSDRPSRGVGAALTVALLAAVVGTYGLLDAQAPSWLGAPMLVGGAVVAVAAGAAAGRRSRRTRYRPDPWGWRETAVAVCGVLAAVLALTDPVLRQTGLPGPPPLSWQALAAAVVAAVPALLRVRSGER